jgi:hypothetical protein
MPAAALHRSELFLTTKREQLIFDASLYLIIYMRTVHTYAPKDHAK